MLATGSEHHCGLTASAVRHVWPLLRVDTWRKRVLQLLFVWSQCSLSGRVMAEYAGRYPEQVEALMELLKSERKEDLLPEGFEDEAKKAADRMELEPEHAVEHLVQSMWGFRAVLLSV